jgi:hypothetical protein
MNIRTGTRSYREEYMLKDVVIMRRTALSRISYAKVGCCSSAKTLSHCAFAVLGAKVCLSLEEIDQCLLRLAGSRAWA